MLEGLVTIFSFSLKTEYN